LADEIDRAQANDEFFRELALKGRQTPGSENRTASGAEACLDCGEPIPEARRRAVPGCVRCVACQGEQERGRKQ
jgi:phage/conjugal plasmid C-4 type zinc finger TraR family protein